MQFFQLMRISCATMTVSHVSVEITLKSLVTCLIQFWNQDLDRCVFISNQKRITLLKRSWAGFRTFEKRIAFPGIDTVDVDSLRDLRIQMFVTSCNWMSKPIKERRLNRLIVLQSTIQQKWLSEITFKWKTVPVLKTHSKIVFNFRIVVLLQS